MLWDFGEGALLVVSSLSLLVHLLLGLWRSHSVTRPRGWLKEWISPFIWGIQLEDGLDKAVAEKLTSTQKRLGTLMSSATLNLYSISVMGALFFHNGDGVSFFAISQEILLISLHLELFFLAHWPENHRTTFVVEGFYGIISLTMAAYKVLHPSTAFPATAMDQNLLMLPRLLLAVSHCHPLSVLAWNLVISTCIILSASTSQAIDLMQGEWAVLVRNELMSTLAFFLVCLCCWIWMLECSRRDVATSMLQVEKSASKSLLAMACDVVVQLDERLCLTQDAPQLAAMFFRRPDMAIKGADFMQFFRPEDADTFQDMLTNSTMNVGTPGTGCFRATFNDGIRNTIRCDLFYVKLRLLEAGSQARFHIGIRESSELKALSELKKSEPLKRSRTGPAFLHRKGTAAYNEAQELRPDTEPAGLKPDSPRTQNQENLRYQNLRKTSGEAMAFDLMCLVCDWNVIVPPVSCCSKHAGLLHARKILKRLEKGGCAKAPEQEPTAMQCRRCGRLDFDMEPGDMDFECPVCNGMEFWPCGEYERRLHLSSSGEGSVEINHHQSLDSTGRPLPSLPKIPHPTLQTERFLLSPELLQMGESEASNITSITSNLTDYASETSVLGPGPIGRSLEPLAEQPLPKPLPAMLMKKQQTAPQLL